MTFQQCINNYKEPDDLYQLGNELGLIFEQFEFFMIKEPTVENNKVFVTLRHESLSGVFVVVLEPNSQLIRFYVAFSDYSLPEHSYIDFYTENDFITQLSRLTDLRGTKLYRQSKDIEQTSKN